MSLGKGKSKGAYTLDIAPLRSESPAFRYGTHSQGIS